VTALPKPLAGNEIIAKVLVGFARFYNLVEHRTRPARVNGLPGFVLSTVQGELIQTIALEPDSHGLIRAIYVVRNPEKLQRVSP